MVIDKTVTREDRVSDEPPSYDSIFIDGPSFTTPQLSTGINLFQSTNTVHQTTNETPSSDIPLGRLSRHREAEQQKPIHTLILSESFDIDERTDDHHLAYVHPTPSKRLSYAQQLRELEKANRRMLQRGQRHLQQGQRHLQRGQRHLQREQQSLHELFRGFMDVGRGSIRESLDVISECHQQLSKASHDLLRQLLSQR